VVKIYPAITAFRPPSKNTRNEQQLILKDRWGLGLSAARDRVAEDQGDSPWSRAAPLSEPPRKGDADKRLRLGSADDPVAAIQLQAKITGIVNRQGEGHANIHRLHIILKRDILA